MSKFANNVRKKRSKLEMTPFFFNIHNIHKNPKINQIAKPFGLRNGF